MGNTSGLRGYFTAQDGYLAALEQDFTLRYGPGHICGFCEFWKPITYGREPGICTKTWEGTDFACREGRKCKIFFPSVMLSLSVVPAVFVEKGGKR